jgi:ABC-type nitrate/sulfonate/bicarbonate transport system permease component
MKLSDVKRRNRFIGVILAVSLTYWSGLDQLLRRAGGPVLLVLALVPFFILFPLAIEWLELKIRKGLAARRAP